MAANKFQIMLDFLVNMKSDPSQIDKMVKDIEAQAKEVNIGVNIEKLKKAITEMVTNINTLEKIDTLFNDASVEAEIKKIEAMLGDIGNIDLSELEKAFDNLDLSGIDEIAKKLQDSVENFDVSKLAKQFEDSKNELETLANTQKMALAQMNMAGQEGTEAYKKLENEIKSVESELDKFAKAAKNIGDINLSVKGADSFVDIAAKFESINQLGEQLSSFSEKGMEFNQSLLEMAAQTNATGEEFEQLKLTAETAFKAGVGESVADAVKAISNAKSQLGGLLKGDDLTSFAIGAGAIGKVFDKDINEVVANSRTFISEFGLEGKKAFDLMALGMRDTANKQDDFLDTIDEYSTHVKRAGFNATEFVGILKNGMQEGIWNTDKLGDAIKETNIRLMEGDVSKELDDMAKNFGDRMPAALMKTITEIVKAGEQGKKSTKEVMSEVSNTILTAKDNGQITESIRDKFARALSGTMAEDMGGEIWSKVFSAKIDTKDIEAQAAEASKKMANAMGPSTVFQQFEKSATLAWTNVSASIAPITSQVGGLLTSVSSVAPAFMVIQNMDFAEMKKSLVEGATAAREFGKTILTKLVPGLFAQTAAQGTATAAQGTFNTVAGMNPYFVGIAALIAAVAALKLLSDALHETAAERLAESKSQAEWNNQQIESNKQQQSTITNNQKLISSYEELGNKRTRTAAEEKKFLDTQVALSEAYPGVISSTKSFSENLTNLQSKAKGAKTELSKLKDEAVKLEKSKLSLQIDIAKGNVDVAMEDLTSTIADANSSINFSSVGEGLLKGLAGPLGQIPELIDGVLTGNLDEIGRAFINGIIGPLQGLLGNKIAKFFNIETEAEQAAKNSTKAFVGQLKNAKNDTDLQKALVAFSIQTNNDTNLSAAEKKSIIEKAQKSVKEQSIAIKTALDAAKGDTKITLTADFGNNKVIDDKYIQDLAKQKGLAVDEVRKMYEGIKDEANNAKIDEVIKSSLEVKGKIGAADQIDKLVKDYQNAGSEIEKARIGEQISKIAPDAVKAGKVITAANGDLVQTYEVMGDKAKEAAEKQKKGQEAILNGNTQKVVDMISSEGKAYEDNKAKMQSLQDEINNRKVKGLPTGELEAQYNSINNMAKENEKDIINGIVRMKQGGLDGEKVYAQLAKMLGKSPEELKKMVVNQEKSIDKTKEQKTVAGDLADAWAKVTAETNKQVQESIAGLAQAKLRLKELRKKDPSQMTDTETKELDSLKKQIPVLTEKGKKSYAISKEQTATFKQSEKEIKGSQEKQKSLYEQIKAIADLKVSSLEVDQAGYELMVNDKALQEDRVAGEMEELLISQNNLKNIQLQKQAWIETLKDKQAAEGTVVTAEGKIFWNTEVTIKPEEKNEILKTFGDFNKKIQDEAKKIQAVKLKLKADDTEIKKVETEFQQQKLEWEISIGIKNETALDSLIEYYKSKFDMTKSEVAKTTQEIEQLNADMETELFYVNGKNSEQEKEVIRIRYGQKINIIKQKNIEQQKEVFDSEQKINDTTKKQLDARINAITERYANVKNIISNSYTESEKVLSDYTTAWLAVASDLSTNKKEEELAKLTELEADYQKEVDGLKERGIYSEEEAQLKKDKLVKEGEERRKALELKFESERIVREAVANGMSVGLQNEKAAKQAQVDKKAAEDKVKVYQKDFKLSDEQVKAIAQAEREANDARLKAAEDTTNEELQQQKALAEEKLKALLPNMTDDQKKGFEDSLKGIDDADKALQEKGTLIGQTLGVIKENIAGSLNALFSGDTEKIKENAKQVLGTIAGILRKQLDAFVIGILLSPATAEYLTAAGPFGIFALGALKILISEAVGAIANPIINGLLSFPTGGDISGLYDRPTAILVGDGAKLGSDNKEWILRNEQLKMLLSAVTYSSTNALSQQLANLTQTLSQPTVVGVLKGSDMLLVMNRANAEQKSRLR